MTKPTSDVVLVVHGAGEPRRRDGRIYWEPLLSRGLGPGVEVRAPRMPDPEHPDDPAWREFRVALGATLTAEYPARNGYVAFPFRRVFAVATIA